MTKRTLIAGLAVFAIGVALLSISALIIHITPIPVDSPYPNGETLVFSQIIGMIFTFAGLILIIYGAITKSPSQRKNLP